jgi:hypothetical protein
MYYVFDDFNYTEILNKLCSLTNLMLLFIILAVNVI